MSICVGESLTVMPSKLTLLLLAEATRAGSVTRLTRAGGAGRPGHRPGGKPRRVYLSTCQNRAPTAAASLRRASAGTGMDGSAPPPPAKSNSCL